MPTYYYLPNGPSSGQGERSSRVLPLNCGTCPGPRAPVGTTAEGKGYSEDHPLSLGGLLRVWGHPLGRTEGRCGPRRGHAPYLADAAWHGAESPQKLIHLDADPGARRISGGSGHVADAKAAPAQEETAGKKSGDGSLAAAGADGIREKRRY
jgi:hypothetical protein